MRRRCLALSLAALLPSPAPSAAEEPPRPLLARIADEKDPGRDEARAVWDGLSADDRGALARASLRSLDPGLAFAAAVAADPESLDLEELRLQARALAPDPLARLVDPSALSGLREGTHAFGSKDLHAIWAAIAQRDPGPKDLDFSALHRSLLPEDVRSLVPLLETAAPAAFGALLEDIRIVSDQQAGEEHRGDFVLAFRYGLARLRAEAAEKPRPRLAALPSLAPKSGLPAEFVELATATWGEGAASFGLTASPPQQSAGGGPRFWLHHWAQRLTPAEEDLPLLVAAVESKETLEQTRIWAARRIAALPGDAAGKAYRELLEFKDAAALHAAAQRAARGDATDWKKLSTPDGDHWLRREKSVGAARWLGDPAAAEAAAFEEMRKGDFPEELAEEERVFLESDLGIKIPEETLRRLSERVRAGKLPLRAQAWFYGSVLPEALTAEIAAGVAASWADGLGEENPDDGVVRRAVALLDAAAPEACVAMLRRWATAVADERAKRAVLSWLARAGDAALVDAMLAAWPSPDWHDLHLLGRVHDPKVEAFLRAKTEGEDPDVQAPAVQALAIFYGCPEPLSAVFGEFSRGEKDAKDEAWKAAKSLVLTKEVVAAALLRSLNDIWIGGSIAAVAGYGMGKDPRLADRLRSWRASRTAETYWPATAAAALAGDEAARAEWLAFGAENRSFLLDQLLDGRLFTLDGDPKATAFWVTRLDSNCCHAWHAHTVLAATYPTMPVSHVAGDVGRARLGAERWFAKHRGTFVRSRILDGWVPGPAPR